MRDKVVLKINRFRLGSKHMVSIATRGVILLKNGTRPTNSIISHRLFILENKTWYQIKASTLAFHPFIKYKNYHKSSNKRPGVAFIRTITFYWEESGKSAHKYVFKQSKHYVCFITSGPYLATLGTFVPG